MPQTKKGYVTSVSGSYAYVSPTGSSSRYQFGRSDVRAGEFAKISVGDQVSFQIGDSGSRATNVRIVFDRKD